MLNRRQLLKCGATVFGAVSFPQVLPAFTNALPGQPVPASHGYYKVICDDRFVESSAFGNRAADLGIDSITVDNDISELWYDDLLPVLSEHPAAIAGLTTDLNAFLFQYLARDIYHHQIFRGEHLIDYGKLTAQRFEAPQNLIYCLNKIDLSQPYWVSDLADIILRYRPDSNPQRCKIIQRSPSVQKEFAGTLVSWIIAPLMRGS